MLGRATTSGRSLAITASSASNSVLAERAVVPAADVRRRDVDEAPQVAHLAGQRQQHPGTLGVDRARLLERQLEGDRRRAVDDPVGRGHERPPVLRAEPEFWEADVAREREDPLGRAGGHGVVELGENRLDPLGRRRAIARAHECDDLRVGLLEQPYEHLHAEEAGRAGDQHAHRSGAPIA